MISRQQPITDVLADDYYETIYNGNVLVPLLVIIVVGVALWWYVKTRTK